MSNDEAYARKEFATLLNNILGLPERSGSAYASMSRLHWVQEATAMLKQDDDELVRLIADQIILGEHETLIREYGFFLPRISNKDLKQGMLLVQMLRLSSLPWSEDYSKEDPVFQSRCVALINVVDAIADITKGKTTSLCYHKPQHSFVTRHWLIPALTNDELEEAVLAAPDDAPRIIEAIRTSGATDYRTVKAIMDGIALPLADGSL